MKKAEQMKITVDTNVLVRAAAQDDKEQAYLISKSFAGS